MSHVVLVTGSSTGIGRATVRKFLKEGWKVVATMRSPEKEREWTSGSNLLVTRLDVTDSASIEEALALAVKTFGRIDALVNNAGYGLLGPFEHITAAQIERQFQTNVFGLMAVTRAVIPYLREQGSGTILNVASMGGRLTFPLYSVYHASKFAVEGFTESLAFELEPLGLRVKVVEPGAIKTDFYDRSVDRPALAATSPYKTFAENAFAKMDKAGAEGTSAEVVAATIFRATTSASSRLRYPVGPDAKSLLILKRLLPDAWFKRIVQLALGLPRKKMVTA